jgi:hypothetical protein
MVIIVPAFIACFKNKKTITIPMTPQEQCEELLQELQYYEQQYREGQISETEMMILISQYRQKIQNIKSQA